MRTSNGLRGGVGALVLAAAGWLSACQSGGAPGTPGSAAPPAAAGSGASSAAIAPTAGSAAATPGSGGGAGAVASAADPAGTGKAELQTRAKQAIDAGLRYLRSQQAEDGSYGNHPGVTAMVLQSFLQSHRKYREADGPFVSRAAEYLAKLAKPNGAIFDKNLPTYNTALSMLALHATENPAYLPLIKKAQDFLVGIQAAEGQHYQPTDKFYGGIGYGNSERPDLPNLQFALEALAQTGYADQAVFNKALRFVERCQNRSESNDQGWAGNDGGFVYNPGDSKAGGTTSYGSMTHAGLMSLMYANLSKSDPRVQDAFRWITQHWDLQSHPGMGDTGLYFYYHTLAKALSVYGEATITDAQGRAHDWSAELIEALIARQNPEGYWVNSNPEYWESNKLLVTARAVLALEGALGLTHEAISAKQPGAGAGSAVAPAAAAAAGAPPAAPATPSAPATPVGGAPGK